MTPTDDANAMPNAPRGGSGPVGSSAAGSEVDRRLILGALDQADRMVMSSVQSNPDGPTIDSADGGRSGEQGALGTGASAQKGTPGTPIMAAAGRARSRAVDLPPGFFPGYTVIREVHRGGQGVVFEAIHQSTDNRVAIKLLHGGATSEGSAITRFEREVAVLQGLDDEGIVRVHGSGRTADGGFYYVMDYIAGEPLDVVVRRLRTGLAEAEPWEQTRSRFTLFARTMPGLSGRRHRTRAHNTTPGPQADPEASFIPQTTERPVATHGRRSSLRSSSRSSVRSAADPELRRLLELFADVCDSVSAAHMRGVIHRDLKPANIRLNERGKPILVDFGLAKIDAETGELGLEHTAMTQTGQFVGSMPWASPEQAAGEHQSVDVRSDVYSLGVILYQLVTGGKFPYKVVGSIREVLDEILYTEPARPSAWGTRVGDELETIILKALAKPRERRYQSAGEFGRDVRRYLDGEPIEAKRDSAFYVISKTVQRHPAPTGVAATAIAAAVVLSVVLGPLYLRANAAFDAASTNYARSVESNGHVRELVRTMLYDFHEEIRDVPGATAARELLLTNAVTYLELLQDRVVEEDAVGPRDWSLVAEVADAHDQVGDLMGGTYAANTGQSDAAVGHLEESRRLREALLAARPNDPAVLIGLAKNGEKRARLLQRNGEFEAAIAVAKETEDRFRRALQLDPDSLESRKGIANTLDYQADQHRRLISSAPTLDGARDRARTAMRLHDETAEVVETIRGVDAETHLSFVAVGDFNVGMTRLQLANRLQDAVDELELAAEANTEPEAEPEANVRAIAELAAEARRERSIALDRLDQALDVMIGIAADNPDSHRVRRDVVIAHLTVARAHERIANASKDEPTARSHRTTAAETLAVGLDLALDLASDASDIEARRDVGLFLVRLATLEMVAGRLDDAEAFALRAVEHRDAIQREDPAVRHIRDLAVAEFRLAEITSKRADAAGDGTAEKATLLGSTLSWFAASRERFVGLADRGVPADREIAELDGLIAGIEGQLAKAR